MKDKHDERSRTCNQFSRVKMNIFQKPLLPIWIEGPLTAAAKCSPSLSRTDKHLDKHENEWIKQVVNEKESVWRELSKFRYYARQENMCQSALLQLLHDANTTVYGGRARHRWPNKTGDDSMLAISLWRHQVYIFSTFFLFFFFNYDRIEGERESWWPN